MLTPNTTIQNRYRIIRMVGAGGMGAIYEATDLRLRTTVALKQMLVTGDVAARAFEREAQILAGLRHPALPRVIDHFSDSNGQFLVMDYIPGDDLSTLLEQRGGTFPVEHTIAWGEQILAALAYLHNQQPPVVHRDIKPQNLKLTPAGEIVLLDFGLAKGQVGGGATSATGRSIFAYTLQYAPPEQLRGAPTEPRSDLYALGATLYTLLTGQPPVDAITRATNVAIRKPDPQPGAHEVNPQVPAAVGAVLLRAMALDVEQRYSGAAQMRAALREATAGRSLNSPSTIHKPISAPPPSSQGGLPSWALPVGLGSAGLVILLFVALAMAFASSPPSVTPTTASENTGPSVLTPVLSETTPIAEPTLHPGETRMPTSTPLAATQTAAPAARETAAAAPATARATRTAAPTETAAATPAVSKPQQQPTTRPRATQARQSTSVPPTLPPVVPTEAPVIVPTEAPVVVPTEAPVVVPTEAPVVVPTSLISIPEPTRDPGGGGGGGGDEGGGGGGEEDEGSGEKP